MPDMDGFEVAQMLKSNKRTKDVPILFASAELKEQKSILKGLEEGAVDYLFKPLDPEVTKAKVSVLLKLELQRKELMEKNKALEKSSILINNCTDIICTIDAESLQFEEFNTAVCTILGYNADEITGNKLSFFLANEDRERIQTFRKSKKDKLSFETRIYCKDRSIKWLHWNIAVSRGKWFANARDITELKQVEQIKNYLSTVVKQSNDAIYLHNDEGKIISWNQGAERIYGYSEQEALNMKLWNIIPQHLFQETQIVIQRIIQGERIDSLETKRITKHGRVIDVLFSASVLTDSDNNLKSIAITERDITERKLADEEIERLNSDLLNNVEQLELANKELESFSYSVSHDLRAPLRALNGYAQIVEEEYGDLLNGEVITLFGNIKRNSNKMGNLIDDLLEFSRIGKKTLKKSTVNMKELVESVFGEMEETLCSKAEIEIQNIPYAYADYALIKQVLINLISNALKYSRKVVHPKIEIGYYLDKDDIVYFVKDNGVGFNMEYKNKLFGVFQRLHSEKEFEGTGVGLAIVARIINKHGGSIWANAEINKGATFYFSLSGELIPNNIRNQTDTELTNNQI
jgi:PAS domain S-box-containing protein